MSAAAEHAREITLWPTLEEAHGSRAPWSYLREMIERPRVLAPSEYRLDVNGKVRPIGLLGWSPATFLRDYRSAATCERLWAIVYDYDRLEIGFGELVDYWRQYGASAHTTASHRPEAPRYRVIVPLGRAVMPQEYSPLWRALARKAEATGHVLDAATKDPSRFWFVPAIPAGREATYRYA